MMDNRKIKTLIADDSATVCAVMKKIMADDGRFELTESAGNGQQAVELNRKYNPDLIIMDLNMPVIDGITATRMIMAESSPAVIAFSSEDAARVGYDCIEAGALEMVPKPDFSRLEDSFPEDFCNRMAAIARMHMKIFPAKDSMEINTKQQKYEVLLIGASTGGPSAVQTVLSGLSKNFPIPILVTQHIDSFFDIQFAQWLNSTTGHKVELAKDNIFPEPGHVYIAPAEVHLTVSKTSSSGQYMLHLNNDPPVHFLKPSVDKMFQSAAKTYGANVLAVLLTGMGRDGASGCVDITKAGGYTIAEAEGSCVVFGMPKAAIEAGGAKSVLPLNDIARFIESKVR